MTLRLEAPGPQDRFGRFVWISLGVHTAVFLGVYLATRLPRTPPREAVVFELVGAPAKGRPGPSTAPAPAPTPETPTPETPVPPEPSPVPPPPPTIPTPDPTIATKPVKPAPASAPGAPASTLPVGPATGSPTGDTLSVGGEGGVPSAMSLWLSRVKFQVERNWSAPPGLPGVVTSPEVVFDVARDGRHGRPRLRVKSGNEILDRLALRAIAAVDVFPPVPTSWKGETVAVRYVLQYAH